MGEKTDELLFVKLKSYFLRDKQLDLRLLDLGFNKTYRTIAIEHVVNEKTMAEISDQLHLSEQTCKNYFCKILKAAPDLRKKKQNSTF